MNEKSKKALQLLREGNVRFRENRMEHPRQDPETREQLTEGQNPFAVLLTCADSRVSPELLFDKGLGDLFVIRNAGNIACPSVIASIEYAVAVLGVSLVVVMGHDKCGAVKAAIDGIEMGHISSILKKIKPSISKANSIPGDLLENTIRMNAQDVAEQLRNTGPIIKEACEEGKLIIKSAVYSLENGEVVFLEDG